MRDDWLRTWKPDIWAKAGSWKLQCIYKMQQRHFWTDRTMHRPVMFLISFQKRLRRLDTRVCRNLQSWYWHCSIQIQLLNPKWYMVWLWWLPILSAIATASCSAIATPSCSASPLLHRPSAEMEMAWLCDFCASQWSCAVNVILHLGHGGLDIFLFFDPPLCLYLHCSFF